MVRRSLVAAVVALLGGSTWGSAQSSEAMLRADSTEVRAYDGRTMPGILLRVRVPERRARPGRTLTVTALRLPSTAERPGRPILFLMGGPGIPGTVMAPIPPYFSLFQRLRGVADVVIVDQRGIGRSEPVVDCPFGRPLPRDLLTARSRMVEVVRREVAACAERWRTEGVDPTAYDTRESAEDLEDLRRALGVERVDLLAFSYGSRLALMYVQRHGEHVGRVVLQGVNGPGLVLKRPGPVARKLERLSGLLARDTSWRGDPDLLAAARAARERLAGSPTTVTVHDRRTGGEARLAVGRDGFDAIAALNLDDPRLPALLVATAAGDDRVLARFVETLWNGLGGSVGLMARAVNCAADRPRSRWRTIRSESRSAPFGMPIDDEFLTDDFCRAVGERSGGPEFDRPLRGDVPALLLTGTLDATNPVENARAVAAGLPGAVLLDVEDAAHEALPIPAVQDAVVDFLKGVDVRGRRIAASPPRFPGVEEASTAAPPRRPRAGQASMAAPSPPAARRSAGARWLFQKRSPGISCPESVAGSAPSSVRAWGTRCGRSSISTWRWWCGSWWRAG